MWMKISGVLAGIVCFFALGSSAKSIELEPIVVGKDRVASGAKLGEYFFQNQLGLLPYSSPEEIAEYLPAVELQKRGSFGIQQDLSIRGSIFEDNIVSLENIEINDPQTGHFSLEIPFTSADIEKVSLDKNRQHLDYKLRLPKEKGTLIRNSFGQHALWENLLSTNFKTGNLKSRVSVEHKTSKGARPDTDFTIYNFSSHSLWECNKGTAEFIFGSTKRDFGANSFYSVNFPHQQEHITQQFYLLKGSLEKEFFDLEGAAYFRRHTDKFILDRRNPDSYPINHHKTYVWGLEKKITFENGVFFKPVLRQEKITSTNLGKQSRINKGFFLGLTEKKIGDFIYQISAGLNYYKPWGYLEDINLNLGYRLRDDLLLKFSFNRFWRTPSFTELHYEDPANIGNPSLGVQRTNNYELGLKFSPLDNIRLSFDFFLRQQSDTIDWVKDSLSDPWQAENIGSLTARGFDFYAELETRKKSLKTIGLGYTYLDLNKDNPYAFSKYVFDYSRHKVFTNFGFDFLGVNSNLIINFSNPVSREKYTRVDLKASKEISDFTIALEGTNIFNQGYQEMIDIPGTGRWYKLSLIYNF